jgi:uncharacterized protein YndB with AHSA1/START domain
MKKGSTLNVRVTRRFGYAAERVFDAWLDVERARRWLFATAEGQMVRAEIDPRVGGRFVLVDRRDGEDAEHFGEYLEIDRPRRLVFEFGMPEYLPEMDRVTVEIVSLGDGCELTLTHEMDEKWAEYREQTEDGWRRMLEAMDLDLATPNGAGTGSETGTGSHGVLTAPDTLRFERRLPGPIDRVWAYLTDPEKRARWLAAGDLEPRVGGRVELIFHNADLGPRQDAVPEKYRHFEGAILAGRVTRFEPPSALAYTWGETAGEDSEVTFELSEAEGEVHLVLTHRRLPDRAALLDTAPGWHTHLDVLADRLAGREPAEPYWTAHDRHEGVYGRRLPA